MSWSWFWIWGNVFCVFMGTFIIATGHASTLTYFLVPLNAMVAIMLYCQVKDMR